MGFWARLFGKKTAETTADLPVDGAGEAAAADAAEGAKAAKNAEDAQGAKSAAAGAVAKSGAGAAPGASAAISASAPKSAATAGAAVKSGAQTAGAKVAASAAGAQTASSAAGAKSAAGAAGAHAGAATAHAAGVAAKGAVAGAARPQRANGNGAHAGAQDGFVDDILSALDRAFDPTSGPAPGQSAPAFDAHDDGPDGVKDLFANIAAAYAQPLKDFIGEVERGTATKDWIEICRPALRSISGAARSMQLTVAADRMEQLDKALAAAAESREPKLPEPLRQAILERYRKLVETMPKTFAFGGEAKQRDGVIIHSLLKQIPEVGRVTIDKIYAAGLTSLDALFLAKRDELAAATGIPMRVAEQIVAKVQQYKEDSSGGNKSSKDLQEYRSRLNRLVSALRATHEAFERAAAADSAEEKRKLRTSRQNFVFQISIVLAELGEVELVKTLDKLAFDRRIQALEDYLVKLSSKK